MEALSLHLPPPANSLEIPFKLHTCPNFPFETLPLPLLPLRISDDFPLGGYGYYLEPHLLLNLLLFV